MKRINLAVGQQIKTSKGLDFYVEEKLPHNKFKAKFKHLAFIIEIVDDRVVINTKNEYLGIVISINDVLEGVSNEPISDISDNR